MVHGFYFSPNEFRVVNPNNGHLIKKFESMEAAQAEYPVIKDTGSLKDFETTL